MSRSGDEVPPPMRSALSSRVQARDITAEFTKAASALHIGQLVKDDFFTLFEAVGALEIMDSKMDSGFLAPGETLDDQYDITKELLPEEVIWIMDQLLCHEMAWHMGHPLSQTLFTSIYIDRLLWPQPRNLESAQFSPQADEVTPGRPLVNKVLRAFCLGLVKSCSYVLSQIAAQPYYEEEDFVTQLYNRNLLTDFAKKDIEREIFQAELWVESQSEMEERYRDALLDRLRSRRSYLSAVEIYWVTDVKDMEVRHSDDFFTCVDLLDALRDQHELGKPVEDSFSHKIQRRLASSVPPRPIVHISFEDAVAFYRRLCQDSIDVQQVLSAERPSHLLALTSTFGSRSPQPCTYVRCVLQKLVFNEMVVLGTMSIRDIVYDDLRELVLPSSVLLQETGRSDKGSSDAQQVVEAELEGFIMKIAQAFLDVYRSPGLNRCRLRRNMCNTILEWDSIQAEAEELDTRLRDYSRETPIVVGVPDGSPSEIYAYPLSSWTYSQKLDQMRQILQLSFELDLCAPEEMAGLYWYLGHICQTHLQHLRRVGMFVDRDKESWTRQQKLQRKKPRSLKKAGDITVSPFQRTLANLQLQTTHLQAISALATTLQLLFVLLSRHSLLPSSSAVSSQSVGKMSPATPTYSAPHLRYELRMKPFLPISLPEIVNYTTFKSESECEDETDADVLDRAERAADAAKKAWEEVLTDGILSGKHDRDDETSTDGPLSWSKRKMRRKDEQVQLQSGTCADGSVGEVEGRQRPHPTSLSTDWKANVKSNYRASIAAGVAIAMTKTLVLGFAKQGKGQVKRDASGKPSVKVELPEVGSKARFSKDWCVPKVLPVV